MASTRGVPQACEPVAGRPLVRVWRHVPEAGGGQVAQAGVLQLHMVGDIHMVHGRAQRSLLLGSCVPGGVCGASPMSCLGWGGALPADAGCCPRRYDAFGGCLGPAAFVSSGRLLLSPLRVD